jgi:hypothetical protein
MRFANQFGSAHITIEDALGGHVIEGFPNFSHCGVDSRIASQRCNQILNGLEHIASRSSEDLRSRQIHLELVAIPNCDSVYPGIAVIANARCGGIIGNERLDPRCAPENRNCP